jgi:hypothetical protein
MSVDLNGTPITKATRTGMQWHATNWPHPLSYNQAITAMTLAEREATHGPDDPFALSWREELANG